MASIRSKVNGRENLNDGIIINMFGLRFMVGNIVLSLRFGGGDTLTRWLNGAPKNKRRSTKKYIDLHTTAKWLI